MENKGLLERFLAKTKKLKNFAYVRHERYPQLDLGLRDEDFLYELAKVNPTNLFLGRFNHEELDSVFRETGLWKMLAERGFDKPLLIIDASNVLEHRLSIYDEVEHPDRLLIEVRLREGVFRPKRCFVPGMEDITDVPMVLIDWLSIQDPRKDFSPDRPRLVHQRKPGLGIFYDFAKLVDLLAVSVGKEAVMDIPEHYHGALLYSKLFHFWEPAMEGKLLAMKRDFASLPLDKVTWAVFLDCCLNADTGEVEKWQPSEQIKPVSDRIKAYFKHREYKRQVEDAFNSLRFRIDEEKLAAARKEIGDKIG